MLRKNINLIRGIEVVIQNEAKCKKIVGFYGWGGGNAFFQRS